MLLIAIWMLWRKTSSSEAARLANQRIFVCAQTGKAFSVELRQGLSIPVKSPYTGQPTGYPAELCYWTKDGKPKDEPTAVLMNRWVGKSGPTFCPDCGRLVVGHNPPASPDRKPPPTRQEYESGGGQELR
ncbi:MAG TPA: hypothetical protein VNL70_10705 [Tepidisphaeraceae bacterium]|nr:hypothetical protein [Tepidisphaeraceae bacterium]